MKVLLDENLPHEFRHELVGHEVVTVHYAGWRGLKNGALLAQAAASGYDVMVTVDNGVAFRQNLSRLPIAIVVLDAPSNDIDDLRPLVPSLLAALGGIAPKTLVRVG